jgi:ribose/xylose/arabinose/galactoside ABC-type transport system permease subunit
VKHSTLVILLAIELAVFAILERPDLDARGGLSGYLVDWLERVIEQTAPASIVAFGMTIIIATAGIDLSVGSMVAFVACVLGSFPASADFWWTAVPLGLVTGVALGAANGLLVARLDMPPIIATLGTMILFRGGCYILLGDVERAPFYDVPGYEELGSFAISGTAVLSLYCVGGFLFHRSRRRREILLIGGNRVAARYAGLRVERRLLEAYALVGVLAAVASLLYTGRNFSIQAGALAGFELQVIVAVVLGGTRVEGGAASLVGTFLGVLVVGVLEEGLRGAALWPGVELAFKISHLRYILLGVLLVAGVWLESRTRSRRERRP